MSNGFEINQKAILRPTIHYTTPNVDFKTALHASEMLSKMNIHSMNITFQNLQTLIMKFIHSFQY